MHRLPSLPRSLAVLGIATLCGCTSGRIDVASAYVKSSQIGPQGGTLTVGTSDDQSLAGTSITIPAGALTQNVVITVTESAQSVTPSGATTAGPVVEFGPDGITFAKPVTIQIPIALPAGSSLAELFIEAVESDGSSSRIKPTSGSTQLATFQVSGFTSFGGCTQDMDGGPAPCQSNSDCPAGETCSSGECVGPAEDGGPAPCGTDSDCGQCQACINGACEQETCTLDAGPACAAGEVSCSGVCADLSSDRHDCGACGVSCAGSCQNGVCEGQPPEDGGPGPCQSDSDCGGECQLCISGVCEQSTCTADAGPSCGGNEVDCSGVCTDLSSNSENCGACDTACPPGSACVAGACQGSESDAGPAPSCFADSDCAAGEVCINGQCEGGSSGIDAGEADAGLTCRTNQNCPQGQTCVAGLCL